MDSPASPDPCDDEGVDPQDVAAIEKGLAQIAGGEYLTVDQARDHFRQRGVLLSEPAAPVLDYSATRSDGHSAWWRGSVRDWAGSAAFVLFVLFLLGLGIEYLGCEGRP
jgi:hypothetical protein